VHTYTPHKIAFSVQKFVQPSIGIVIGIGIGTAVANIIGYRAPARYWSNPNCKLYVIKCSQRRVFIYNNKNTNYTTKLITTVRY